MPAPISGVVADGSPVSKADFRSYVNTRTRVRMADVAEVVANDLSGILGIDVGGAIYELDAADTTSAHDGVTVLVDSGGHRFKLPGLFLRLGGIINWANGDVTLTHSANTLTFAGATNYIFDAKITLTGNVATAPHVRASASYALAQNDELVIFGANSGLAIVTDNTNGSTAAIVVGGGGVVILGQSSGSSFAVTSTPSTSQTGVFYDGAGNYRIKNGFAVSHTYYAITLGTRPTA